MSYSLDPTANKENAFSPSSVFSMTEQLLYKLAALDASVHSGFRRMDEKMDRFQSDLHDSQISANDRISALDKETADRFSHKRQRLDEIDRRINNEVIKSEDKVRENCLEINKRVQELETWNKVLMARAGIVGAMVLAAWTFVAPIIRTAFGVANG